MPDGPHVVMAFKTQFNIRKRTHISSHVYTKSMQDLSFLYTTYKFEPLDSYPEINGQPSWPDDNVEEWELGAIPNDPARRRAHFGGRLEASPPDNDGWQYVSH